MEVGFGSGERSFERSSALHSSQRFCALVNRRNRGLEDVAFRTVVTYDWLPTSYEPLAELSIDAQPMIEVRQSSVPIVRS
jgi:hypothetical protein